MGSSLLSTLNMQINSGTELDKMMDFIMNLKTNLIKSKKSNEKAHKSQEKSFTVTIDKFNTTLKFHKEKKDYFEKRIKSFEERIVGVRDTKGEVENLKKDFKFYQNLNETKFNNQTFIEIKREILILQKDFFIVQRTIKGVLNSSNKKEEEVNTKLENYLEGISQNYAILISMKNVKITPQTKERLINILYKFKNKIKSLQGVREKNLEKIMSLAKNYHPILNSVLASYMIKLKSFKKVNVSNIRENIKTMHTLLKLHSDSVGINQQEIKRLVLSKIKENDMYKKMRGDLIHSIRALNKVKKILLNNFSELKDYFKNKHSKTKK